MDDAREGSRATRRQVLGATAGALAVGALPGRSTAQQASGPTVYVGSKDNTLYAVDAVTGSQEWAFTQPSDWVDSSPTVADGTVYVGSLDSNLYAVDAVTGSQEWAFTQPFAALESSPTVVDGTVYIGSQASENTLYAVDADSGEEEWAFVSSGFVQSSPTVANGTVYVGSSQFDPGDGANNGTLYAVDAATGTRQWAFTQPFNQVNSSPTVADGTVYAGSNDGTLYAVDADSGEEEWAFTQPSEQVFSSPTVADGTVYVGSYDRTLYAVDADSGNQEWAFTQPSAGVYSSPTVADGTVYAGSNAGMLYAVDADSGEEEWAFAHGGGRSSPTVADGTVYVGSFDDTLYAVDVATGSQEWAFTQPSAGVGSSPTVVADPESGDSVGSRVRLGTLGHHGNRADRVTKSSPASFAVTIGETAQTRSGEPITVAVDVENTGDEAGTGSIELSVPDLGSTSEPVSLDGGEVTTDFVLSLQTTEGDAGEYTATVSTDDDSAERRVTVLAPAAFTVDIEETNDPVAGDSLEATVSVENTGDEAGTRSIELSVPDLGSTSEPVLLDGGEVTTDFVLSLQTTEGDAGEYTATVSTDDDSAERTVTVLAPAAFTVDIEETNDPVAGDSLEATVSVENTGDTPGNQTVELSASGLGSDSTTVSVDGGDSTTETLSLPTADGDAGEYTVTVDASNDEATEIVTVAEPDTDDASGDDSGTSGDDGGVSGDDSGSSDDGEPSDGSDTSDDSADSESSGDGGFGTTEMAAVGGGGGLALLFGAYALMRRGGDDSDDTGTDRPPTASNGSETTRGDAGASTPRQPPDSGPGDTIDDLLNDAVTGLDSAAETLDRDSFQRAEQTLDSVADTLDTARAAVERHDPPGLADRLASLDRRHDRLRQQLNDQRTWVPTEIPDVTRHSLSYDDIEKGDPLGSGGNADVYHATAATDDGTVELALKEPRMSGTLTIETAERMMQEAETWQQLDDHDHIVGVVDYDAEPLPWIAMEYMDGGHLGECAGEMELPQKLWTAVAVTRGVRHAHTRGIAHLDLKPANVLFRSVEDAWNVPKVADWGLSKHLLNHSKSMEGLSPHYAAPEQFAADEYGSVDQVTDVYQLGAVFYELLTGRPPFEGQPFEVMKQIESAEPTPPSEIADVPAALDDILLRALATEKPERYEAVLLLRNDLQELRDSL